MILSPKWNCHALLRELRDLFNVGIGYTLSTTFDWFRSRGLQRWQVAFPWDKLEEQRACFREKFGIPCVAVLDGLHLPYGSPSLEYMSRSGDSTILCLFLVDASMRIVYVVAGLPGRSSDPGGLLFTTLWSIGLPRLAHAGHFVLADGIFASNKAVLTPYDHRSMRQRTLGQKRLQKRIIWTRSIVERTFAMLLRRQRFIREGRSSMSKRWWNGCTWPPVCTTDTWRRTIRSVTSERTRTRRLTWSQRLISCSRREISIVWGCLTEGWHGLPHWAVLRMRSACATG